jgi:hypothetical protein
MSVEILEVLFLSLSLNVLLYALYRTFISKRLSRSLQELEKLQARINTVVPKRRDRVYMKLSKDIKRYNNAVYFYSLLQSMVLLALYMIGLFFVFSMNFVLYFPFYVPLLTVRIEGRNVLVEGPLLLYILSFLVFTPLSLRRPKANIS